MTIRCTKTKRPALGSLSNVQPRVRPWHKASGRAIERSMFRRKGVDWLIDPLRSIRRWLAP